MRGKTILGGQKRHDLSRFVAISLRAGGFRTPEVNARVDPLGGNPNSITLDQGDTAGETGFLIVKRVKGLSTAGSIRLGISAAQDTILRRGRDMQIRRKAVHGIPAHREPARRIQEVSVIRMKSGKLDSVHRRIFIACQLAAIGQSNFRRLPFGQAIRKGNLDSKVLRVAGCRQILPSSANCFRYGKSIIQLKRSVADIIERRKVNSGGRREGLRARIDVGINRILLNFEGRPLRLPQQADSGRQEQGAQLERAQHYFIVS